MGLFKKNAGFSAYGKSLAKSRKKTKRTVGKMANSIGMGATMLTNPVLGLTMMALDGSGKKKKRK